MSNEEGFACVFFEERLCGSLLATMQFSLEIDEKRGLEYQPADHLSSGGESEAFNSSSRSSSAGA